MYFHYFLSVTETNAAKTLLTQKIDTKKKVVESAPIVAKPKPAKPAAHGQEKLPIQPRKPSHKTNLTARKSLPSSVKVAQEPKPPIIANTEPTEIVRSPDLFSCLANHSIEQTHGPSDQSKMPVSPSTNAAAPSTSQRPSKRAKGPNLGSLPIQNVVSGQAANAKFYDFF